MDMNFLMKQAQELQQKMAKIQEDLATKTISSEVGGGMVKATVNGKQEVVSIQIEKEIIDPNDPVILQDLVISAVNKALRESREMVQAEMSRLTGGIKLPGMM